MSDDKDEVQQAAQALMGVSPEDYEQLKNSSIAILEMLIKRLRDDRAGRLEFRAECVSPHQVRGEERVYEYSVKVSDVRWGRHPNPLGCLVIGRPPWHMGG
jgi:hypothetical protein